MDWQGEALAFEGIMLSIRLGVEILLCYFLKKMLREVMLSFFVNCCLMIFSLIGIIYESVILLLLLQAAALLDAGVLRMYWIESC
jgi:hypothetical protein